ncbi:MAG: recombinase A [Deltaproteobacteria bacterium]|nr:recombinase A [Deltaproteobacteria bacterium]
MEDALRHLRQSQLSFIGAAALSRRAPQGAALSLESVAALSGRLVEVSGTGGHACLSVAMQWVKATQVAGELAAWVQLGPSVPFIPDVAALGIDLSALPFIVMPTIASALRSAEHVLRSGAFGLVVIDTGLSLCGLRQREPELQAAMLSRLLGLAQKHHTAVVCLSEKKREAPSLGSLVSLRLHCARKKLAVSGAEIVCEVVKDKHSGPGSVAEWSFAAVAGVK